MMFKDMARSVNLDPKKLEACTENADIKALILDEKAKGKSRGVESTPTYFVNDKMVVGFKTLDGELKSLLKGGGNQ